MKRKKHSASFKFKVALAAYKGDKTILEICQQYEIAASLVHKWKKELQEQGVEIFSSPAKKTKVKQAEKAQSKTIGSPRFSVNPNQLIPNQIIDILKGPNAVFETSVLH